MASLDTAMIVLAGIALFAAFVSPALHPRFVVLGFGKVF
jgi:hypothetical protein